MTALQQIYGESVHDKFPAYFANWPPNQRVGLGTLGVVQHYTFQALDDLKGRDPLKIEAREGESPALFQFGTAMQMSIAGRVSASAANENAAASAVFKFTKRGGLFFCAAGARSTRISNQMDVSEAMLRLFRLRLWSPEWVLVVGTLPAAALTLLISDAASAEMHLQAKGSLDAIDFADSSIAGKLETRYEKEIAFQWVAERGLTPLVRLARIRRRFARGVHVQTEFAASDGPAREAQGKLLCEHRDRVLAAGGSMADEFEVCEMGTQAGSEDA